jgi:hypothetical protein
MGSFTIQQTWKQHKLRKEIVYFCNSARQFLSKKFESLGLSLSWIWEFALSQSKFSSKTKYYCLLNFPLLITYNCLIGSDYSLWTFRLPLIIFTNKRSNHSKLALWHMHQFIRMPAMINWQDQLCVQLPVKLVQVGFYNKGQKVSDLSWTTSHSGNSIVTVQHRTIYTYLVVY